MLRTGLGALICAALLWVGGARADDDGGGGGGGSAGGGGGGGGGGYFEHQPQRPLPQWLRRLDPTRQHAAPRPQRAPARRAVAPRAQPEQTQAAARPRAAAAGRAAEVVDSWVPGELLAVDLGFLQWARLRSLGITVKESRVLPSLGMQLTRLQMPFDASETHVLAVLRARMPELDVALNHHYRLTGERCEGGRCFGHAVIQWPRPGQEQCPIPARIGMLDTAVDAARAKVQAVVRRFGDRDEPSASTHGSAVATLLAGRHDAGALGLLPASTVYAADVFDLDAENEVQANAANLAFALDWLYGEKMDVINISLAGPDNPVLARSVARLIEAGIPIVASAGNDGPQARPAYPAAYAGVIAVTAVDARKRLYPQANRGEYIGFAAPGVRVWAPADDAFHTGTSFATPFVTAIVASLVHERKMPLAQLERALAGQAEDLGAPGHDPLYGWGLVQGAGVCAAETKAPAAGGPGGGVQQ